MIHPLEVSIIGAFIIRIGAVLLFLYAYYKSRRKSALFFALSWISAIPTATFGLINIKIENALVSLAFALFTLGLFSMLKEEANVPIPKAGVIVQPLVIALFGIGESIIERNPEDGYIFGGLLTVILGAIAIETLSPYYGRDGKGLGIALMISGVASAIYPLFSKTKIPQLWSVGQIVALAVGASLFYFYYKIVSSPRFIKNEDIRVAEFPELEGVLIIPPEGFKQIKTQLKDYPVLAFLRSLRPSEKWNSFIFTTIERPNGIYPTDLYKITDMVNRYIFEMKRSNLRGIVLIEGLEFLRLYNEFPSIAKMLSAVRDYVVSNNGALIVVADKNAWDEKEWNALRRVLE
ncbi:DUF835 domain-containing protein [Thermococcus alcaliphilus]|uniref:DUF835 domain-containing protein n=1 Tax=Thermococcus alcaliphilus TaxID=139207 RepID=UPI0020904B16|nr:DUF835 domain-containing protein [Thermococcus alcaliphilus]MCO6041644.1 DUF835 domain-containing protein [Thermococcus alcaliphilus]